MEYKNIFDIEWTWKNICLFSLLAFLPNLLGMYHYTIFGVRIHFFQYLVFLGGIIYGPVGGMVAGGVGSVWTAVGLGNPYIIVGNIILGFFVGYFVRLRWNIIMAVLVAYLIQLPWLWLTDVYLAGMPVNVVKGVVIGLFISNVIWAGAAGWSSRYVKRLVL